jgi:WD40 repeat protein
MQRNRITLLFIGIPLLLIAGVGCAAQGAADTAQAPPLALQEATAMPTATTEPTRTTVPTSTPQPTVTPSPTPSPMPTREAITQENIDRLVLEQTLFYANEGSILISPDGLSMVIGPEQEYDGESYRIPLIRLADNTVIREFGDDSSVLTPHGFSPDGELLITGNKSLQKSYIIWNVADGEVVQVFDEIDDSSAIAISHDNRIFARARDGGVELWDIREGRLLRVLRGKIDEYFGSVDFSPDDTLIVTNSSYDGIEGSRVLVWSVSTGEALYSYDVDFPIVTTVFSPDGKYVATSGDFDKTYIWSTSTGRVQQIINTNAYSIAFNSDSTLLIASTVDYAGSNLEAWDIDGRLIHREERTYSIFRVTFSLDGGTLYSYGFDGIDLWTVE